MNSKASPLYYIDKSQRGEREKERFKTDKKDVFLKH